MSVVGPKALRRHVREHGLSMACVTTPATLKSSHRIVIKDRDSMLAGSPLPADLGAMHRYAGHDAKRLTLALQNIRRCSKPLADIGLANAWGNTLLHTACASVGASRQVSLLLKAGADVHAVGPYGLTPLAAALNARQWKSADRVAKAGGAVALGAFNEPSERSFLANVFGIDGVTYLHGQAFELEGAFDFGVYPRLAEAVEAFARTLADRSLISPELWTQSAQALREAPSHTYLPGRAVHACVRANAPTLLPTGWRGHSICIALLGKLAVRANRNRSSAWSGYKTLQPWRFHGGVISRKHLQCLIDNRGRSAWLGKGLLLWEDAAHRLKKTHALAHTCASLAPKPQKAHNCTVANAKAGLLALLILLRAQTGIHETDATRARLQREYKRLTTFIRLYFLERYRLLHAAPCAAGADPPDADLIEQCEAKLRASVSRRFCMAALRKACASEAQRC